jgi:hypothetical protein
MEISDSVIFNSFIKRNFILYTINIYKNNIKIIQK